jgi:hypothetical protein
MTSANREQLVWVRETTPGTTPTTPRMRKARITGEALDLFKPEYDDPDELRDDRMNDDATLLFQSASGSVNANMSYPVNLSPLSDWIASTFYNEWTVTPERDKDGTADSVITDVAATGGVFTVTAGGGDPFVAGHLIHTTEFTNSGNNSVFKITTGSDTVPAVGNSLLTNEAAPPAGARIKVVGFQGAAADITATADGLASTLLDFTTLGIVVGQTLKIGGTAAGDKFATAALNVFVTVAAIATNLITLANKPAGWTTDAGTGKTLKVWFGDSIKNGVLTAATRVAGTMEKGFLGQAVPSYIVGTGLSVNSGVFSLKHKDKFRAVFNFLGMTGSESTTALDASPDAVTTNSVMSGNVNVGRLSEGGSLLASPNFCRSLEVTINNNLRPIEDVTQAFAAGINDGECTVDVKFETYYGSDSIYAKFSNGTPTSIHTVLNKNSQAIAIHLPRLVYRVGSPPSGSGKNTDVMLSLTGRSSKDTTTGCHVMMDRLEYYE